MNGDDQLPPRMRRYRIEAELRESPDLHRLAQLFVQMALARTEQDRQDTAGDIDPKNTGPGDDTRVESHP